jgi:phosphoglycerate dehydrogenase-like enzyme
MRIAVLDDYHRRAAALADWPPETTFFHAPIATEQLPAELYEFEALVLMRERTKFPREVLEQLPNLKVVITTGMRNAALDVDYLHERGVTVCGTGIPGYGQQAGGVQSTVEIAWGLIMAIVKRIPWEDRALRDGAWQTGFPRNLAGLTLGLVGLGRLGQQMVAPATVFGMSVLGWSENLTAERAERAGAQYVSKQELLERSDILSIHLVLSDRTRGLIGAAELEQMKPGAILINTSRGPIVDQDALIRGLRAGKPAAAGLDVFDQEPLPPGHPLTELENTVLTPHLGYVSEDSFRSMYTECVEDLKAYAAGEPIRVL